MLNIIGCIILNLFAINALASLSDNGNVLSKEPISSNDSKPPQKCENIFITAEFAPNYAEGAAEVLEPCIGDINKRNWLFQETALHRAVSGRKIHAVKWLLAHGAKTDIRDEFGRTALDRAIIYRNEAQNILQDYWGFVERRERFNPRSHYFPPVSCFEERVRKLNEIITELQKAASNK